MRKLIICVTSCSLVLTQTLAVADPHDEGVAAGQAANPSIRSSVTESGAAAVVPGYTATPPQNALYGTPNLAGQANARLLACQATPDDPVCQAQRGAVTSANMPREMVRADDPSVAAAQAIARNPGTVLGDLSSFYAGCTTTQVTTPAGTQTRSCLRYQGIGNFSCSKTLTVGIERSTSCSPGEWFAHAGSGRIGLDVQCLPDRPDTAQHFRVTRDAAPLAFFDADMTAPVAFPQLAAVLGTTSSRSGAPIRTGVWIADKSCTDATCTLTALVAAEAREDCTGNADSGYTCTPIEPFLKRYAACRPGTQSGDNIRGSTCSGDGDCTATVLDGAKCYAPASGWTPYSGNDITGTLPAHYWNIDSDRAIVGWSPNPTYGAIPTMRLTYEKPRTTATQTDRWDDQCPPLAADGRCTASTGPACIDGPSTKVIDGIPVFRSCWQYRSTMSCAGAAPFDQCAPLAAAGCTPLASRCQRTHPGTGACEVHQDDYSCPVPARTVTTASNCPANVFCLGNGCFNIGYANDADFARSMSLLEAAREAGVYMDTDRLQVFKGEDNRCRDRLLKNCCYANSAGAGMSNRSMFGMGSRLVHDVLTNSQNREFLYHGVKALLTGAGFNGAFSSYGVTVAVNGTALPTGSAVLYAGDSVVVAFDPWSLAVTTVIYVALSMSSCNQDEGQLAMKEGAGLCHAVGTWCSSCIRVLGRCVSCIERTTSKCCFNSRLARIVNEQGRRQVGKGWGTAESPDCSGFAVAQLQSLDFAAMDLSEVYASLVPAMPDLGALRSGNATRVPACYFGQGKC